MPRTHGYYSVKLSGDPQLQIVLIQEDGNMRVFGESQPRGVPGDEPGSSKNLELQVIAGPLIPPEIPETPEPCALGCA